MNWEASPARNYLGTHNAFDGQPPSYDVLDHDHMEGRYCFLPATHPLSTHGTRTSIFVWKTVLFQTSVHECAVGLTHPKTCGGASPGLLRCSEMGT